MRLGIMQPYFVPYIGYFQLMNFCDEFVFLNDVNYIKQGWIHRNRMIINNKIDYITLHAHKPSQNKLIKEIKLNTDNKWKDGLFHKVYNSYSNINVYTNLQDTSEILYSTLYHTYSEYLSDKAIQSVMNVGSYLECLPKKIHCSSMIDCQGKRGEDRVLHICKELGATEYINPIGGLHLYSKEKFKENEIKLSFIKKEKINYTSNIEEENLSILHIMMSNNKEQIKEYLTKYSLQ